MKNSKKLSWSKISTLCLSLLLCLMLVLSFTGAWFTDSATSNSTPTELNFGKVNISIVDNSVTITPATAVIDKLLPGDHFTLSGSIDTSNADVPMYVYVEAQTVFKINNNGTEKQYGALYADNACTTPIVTLSSLQLATSVTGWEHLATIYTDSSKTKVKGYLYQVEAPTLVADFKGSIEVSQNTNNIVYGKPIVGGVEQSAEQVVLNDTDTYHNIKSKIQLSLYVNATQVANVADLDEAMEILEIDGTYELAPAGPLI